MSIPNNFKHDKVFIYNIIKYYTLLYSLLNKNTIKFMYNFIVIILKIQNLGIKIIQNKIILKNVFF